MPLYPRLSTVSNNYRSSTLLEKERSFPLRNKAADMSQMPFHALRLSKIYFYECNQLIYADHLGKLEDAEQDNILSVRQCSTVSVDWVLPIILTKHPSTKFLIRFRLHAAGSAFTLLMQMTFDREEDSFTDKTATSSILVVPSNTLRMPYSLLPEGLYRFGDALVMPLMMLVLQSLQHPTVQ